MPEVNYYDSGRREGCYIALLFAVPPDIAERINRQMEEWLKHETPYFPHLLTDALFPGAFGPDVNTQIKVETATQLRVVDARGDRRNYQVTTYQYPRPIPVYPVSE